MPFLGVKEFQMTAWCHLPTIFKQRHALRIVGLVLLCVALITTLFFTAVSRAIPNTTKTINFQGRVLTAAGTVVADGHYNLQFKIYQGGSGTTAGNPGGSLKWTESYTNNGANNGVLVKNGFFSVSLGSVTPFGTSVDWDQDVLWLSMNIAGSAAGCTTFGTGTCSADGEMLPMNRITATPYAINAGAVNGKTADNFVQLAQGIQVDASLNTSSIHINKTGTGNLMQLQNAGSDIFSVTNTGNLEFGSSHDHAIYVGGAAPDTAGKNLTLFAGYGGSGAGSMGGGLFLQGGSAGGDNGEGGSVTITGGAGTGTGKNGSVYIGTSDTDAVQIGSANLSSGTQTINIGNNNVAGGTTNITIGSGGDATGGTTNIQAKNQVTISTNGTTRATFADTTNTVYFGNGVSAAAPDNFTLQGTNSSANAVAGGTLTVQGGNATTGDANGGNIVLTGGTSSGSGANGLVVITTPTFSTVTNDTNCYTDGAPVASSCTIATTSVDNSAAIMVGFSASGQTATLPDPTITTPGRALYIMAVGSTQDFTLAINGGGAGNLIPMRKNVTLPLIWNGTDWTIVGSSSSATLQDAYDNTPQSAGGTELMLTDGATTGALTIRNNSTNPINGSLLDIQSAGASSLFSVNNNANEYASNPGAEKSGSSAVAFPADTWSGTQAATVSRHDTAGSNIESGQGSVKISTTIGQGGAYNRFSSALQATKSYTVSFSIRTGTGSADNISALYSSDGTTTQSCVADIAVTSDEWKRVTCSFQTPASGITALNGIIIAPLAGSGSLTYYIDNLSVTDNSQSGVATPNVKVGGGDDATLFTLDRSSSAPTSANHDALLGSMYYDTTLGKVQCYETEGWGACGSSPDSFVTISPEYTNAVMHGSDTGTLKSDLCSDTLNINDGSSGQPTICGAKETYNLYRWSTSDSADQTRSIFVTYQLPATFKEFVPGSTSLLGRTDSTDSTVTYQIYRNNSNGLTACGSDVSVSTGSQSTWKKIAATGNSDPSACNFKAGDNIVIRVNLTAKDNANAYVSNLGFTFSNN